MINLPPRAKALYDALRTKKEVLIEDLYPIVSNVETDDPRYRQQFVGAALSKLNRRIKASGFKAVPGRTKRTYTLISV